MSHDELRSPSTVIRLHSPINVRVDIPPVFIVKSPIRVSCSESYAQCLKILIEKVHQRAQECRRMLGSCVGIASIRTLLMTNDGDSRDD